jgi:uncharacterized protein YcsI (UPF0317 family)
VDQPPDLTRLPPQEARQMIRQRQLTGTTIGVSDGYVQANLVILPEKDAFDFLRFCERNPKPCPVLGVTSPGNPHPEELAKDADLRTDLIRYKVYRHGKRVAEVDNIVDLWRPDLVAFLIGCSLSFDHALLQAGFRLDYREEEQGRVYVYVSGIRCLPAGRFSGPMVVSMRPIPGDRVAEAAAITGRFPKVHGSPVYIGDPAGIGIDETVEQVMKSYDLGSIRCVIPELPRHLTPVFWGCGITPQTAAIESRVEFMITHGPATLFLTDLKTEELAAY